MGTWQSFNPTTGEALGTFAADDADAVKSRVQRARMAFPAWHDTPIAERIRRLKILKRKLAAGAPELARAVTLDIGKPITESLSAEVLLAFDGLDNLIKQAPKTLRSRRITGGTNARVVGFRRAIIRREPLGVVGILGAWNYPIFLNVMQVATALVAGNVVVWKPSELASFVAGKLLKLFRESGFDEGVLEVAFGGPETGKALAEAACDKYIMTGGLTAGRALLKTIAHTITPAVLELSGQESAVVCVDADVEATARTLVWGAFTNCGQTCVAVRKIYYDRAIESTFVPAFIEHAEKLRVGNPLKPNTDVGPLRTSEQVEHVEKLVEKAIADGAKVLFGGQRVELGAGNFFAPTALTGIDETSDFFDEEIFEPITVLCPVADASEGIERANRSRYSLGASIWTRNRAQGKQLARGFHAGLVSVNNVIVPVGDCRLPFGGLKQSGYGKTHGASGLLEMTAEQVVADYRTPPPGRGNSFPYSPAMVPMLEALFKLRSARGVGSKLRAFWRLLWRLGTFLRARN